MLNRPAHQIVMTSMRDQRAAPRRCGYYRRTLLFGTWRKMDKAIDYDVWAPRVLALLRIMVGLLFLEHGTQKLLGFPPSANPGPTLLSLMGIQGIIELVGGILIVLGLFTRPVAFILSGDMAVAYFMSHFPNSFFPIINRGD